jgi:hypothetical protein
MLADSALLESRCNAKARSPLTNALSFICPTAFYCRADGM